MAKQVEKQQVEEQEAVTTEKVAPEKTMKRGTIIQAFKAIAVLVCICLVCGALLALCNDIFFISDAERERRSEAKINAALKDVYPDLENPQTIAINKEFQTNANYGTVTKVVKSADGTYILAVVGVGGYKNGVTANGLAGSITVLVVINQQAKIVAWKISDGGQETWLNMVEPHTDWYVGEEVSTDMPLLQAGATYTSTALNNAIKMASYYAMNVLNLGENPEKDARDALAAVLEGTVYADYEWTTNLDADYRTASNVTYTVSAEGGEDQQVTATLSYYFVGTKADSQDLAAYAFKVGDEIQIVVTNENVTHDNRTVLVTSEGVNDAVANSVKNRSYFEYTIRKTYADFTFASVEEVNFTGAAGGVNKIYLSGDGARIFEATGKGDYGTGDGSGVVTINVVVDENNKMLGWSFVSTTTPTGSAYVISKVLPDTNSKNWYKNETITSTIEMGANKTSGASMSSTAINNAIKSIGAYLEQGGSN